MLERWEVERAMAWRRKRHAVAASQRLAGNAEFTKRAADDKLREISKPRATCVTTRKLPTMRQGEMEF